MKLGEGEEILSVDTCTESDDILLTTAAGQCIRFPVPEVRVFAGRNSVGVRGIALGDDDKVISMAVLGHFEASSAERDAYIKMSRAVRGEGEPEEAPAPEADDEESEPFVHRRILSGCPAPCREPPLSEPLSTDARTRRPARAG